MSLTKSDFEFDLPNCQVIFTLFFEELIIYVERLYLAEENSQLAKGDEW